MGEKLRYTITGRVHDQETFSALGKRWVQETESNEPGTLDYEWFCNDNHFFIHELYEDSKAFLRHMELGQANGMVDEFLACVTIDDVIVMTKPTPEAREVLDGFGSRYMRGIGGVVR